MQGLPPAVIRLAGADGSAPKGSEGAVLSCISLIANRPTASQVMAYPSHMTRAYWCGQCSSMSCRIDLPIVSPAACRLDMLHDICQNALVSTGLAHVLGGLSDSIVRSLATHMTRDAWKLRLICSFQTPTLRVLVLRGPTLGGVPPAMTQCVGESMSQQGANGSTPGESERL